MDMSRDKELKGDESPFMEKSRGNDQKNAYLNYKVQLQNHSLTFFQKNKALLSATSILSRLSMADNTTASLNKLTCTGYVDFGKCQDRFEQFSWSKIDSSYLDVKLKVFKKGDNKQFRLAENLTIGEGDFNQFIRMKKQLILAAEKIAREENSSPVLIRVFIRTLDK